MTDLEELVAARRIATLKARYCRFVDAKDWAGLPGLFCADATLHFPPILAAPLALDAAIAFMRDRLDGLATIHRVHQSEIELLTETSGRGVWRMSDILTPQSQARRGDGMRGFGDYHETYARVGGDWRIKSLTLQRLARFAWPHPSLPPAEIHRHSTGERP